MQDARRWVVDTCVDIGRTDLVECAELGVSELVTNALLHAEAPIDVRVRGTREHPRIEVHDGSVERPALPTEHATADEVDPDGLLLTFGRGLSIVARCSDAWGAEIESGGKIVWFAPSTGFAADDGVEGVITGGDDDEAGRRTPEDPIEIIATGVPLRTYVGFQRHFRELRREVRLLSLAHEADYPLAKNLSDLFGALDRQLREGVGVEQIESAIAGGQETTDLRVMVSRGSTDTVARFIELLDLADAFCREERLLSLARSPEQRHFQTWFLGEFVRQGRGLAPLAWSAARASADASSAS